jgi:hypothetical protein
MPTPRTPRATSGLSRSVASPASATAEKPLLIHAGGVEDQVGEPEPWIGAYLFDLLLGDRLTRSTGSRPARVPALQRAATLGSVWRNSLSHGEQ